MQQRLGLDSGRSAPVMPCQADGCQGTQPGSGYAACPLEPGHELADTLTGAQPGFGLPLIRHGSVLRYMGDTAGEFRGTSEP